MKTVIWIALALGTLVVTSPVVQDRPEPTSPEVQDRQVVARVRLEPTAPQAESRPMPVDAPLVETAAETGRPTVSPESLAISEKCGGRCHDPRQVLAEPYDTATAETIVDSMAKRATLELSTEERATLVQAMSRR